MCTVYGQCFCNILGFLKIKNHRWKNVRNYVTNTAKNIKNYVTNTAKNIKNNVTTGIYLEKIAN